LAWQTRVAVIASTPYYSVISPERCAGIFVKSHEHAPKCPPPALKFTSGHLKRLGIVDGRA